MTYSKKAQVLLTEQQYDTLIELAQESGKKLGTLIREAIEVVYMEKKRKENTAEAVDRLLSLPKTPVPKDYQQWEKEYSGLKGEEGPR